MSPDERYISDLHSKLAGETLRADLGWDRYEAANRRALAADKEIERLNIELHKLEATRKPYPLGWKPTYLQNLYLQNILPRKRGDKIIVHHVTDKGGKCQVEIERYRPVGRGKNRRVEILFERVIL